MELHEAQLFRALVGCFGEDRVLFGLRASMVCRSSSRGHLGNEAAVDWDLLAHFLFTIIDEEGDPHLVVEFDCEPVGDVIDITALERREIIKPLLSNLGLRYLVLSRAEFQETIDPSSEITLATLLLGKIEASGESDFNGSD